MAGLLNAQYGPALSYVLRLRPWNCAIKRATLAPLSTTPVFGWAYAYNLPGDCVSVLSITSDESPQEFTIEDGQLLCDVDVVYLRYVYLNDDPASYDAGLLECLTLNIAQRIAYAITNSSTREDMLDAKLKACLKLSAAADCRERPSVQFAPSRLSRVRRI